MLNNRFYPEHLLYCLSLTANILGEMIDFSYINFLYKKYQTLPIKECKGDKTVYNKYKEKLKQILIEEIESVKWVLAKFYQEFFEVEVKEVESKKYDGKGVIAIIHPFYTHEVK